MKLPDPASDLSQVNDEALVQLVRHRGDRDDRPFAALYARHRGLVWSVSHRYLGNPEDAEDMVQEVFIRAYRGLDSFAGRASFRTWLFQITVNVCLNERRRLARRPSQVKVQLEDLKLPDPSQTPGQPAGRQHELLHAALMTLAEPDRQILLLREFESLPYAAIADMMQLGLSAAKMRVTRARIALHQAIRELEEDWDA